MSRYGESSPIVAIVLAGGTGSRFGGRNPKQLVSLAGQPILAHTLRKFSAGDLPLDLVVVVGNSDWEHEIKEVCESCFPKQNYQLVSGGESRNGSVRAAIEALSGYGEARILIHDGVRPLVSKALIARVATSLRGSGCVMPVIPSVDPIVHVIDEKVVDFQDRSAYYRGQSPQGFWLTDLRVAFAKAQTSFGSDGPFSTVYELMRFANPAIAIHTVAGDLNNLKITMPVDHLMAGRLLLEE